MANYSDLVIHVDQVRVATRINSFVVPAIAEQEMNKWNLFLTLISFSYSIFYWTG